MQVTTSATREGAIDSLPDRKEQGVKLAVVVASVVILVLSWRSLRDRHSHGFYRFFAFEFTLVLVALNVDYWFVEPFSVLHIVAWLLLLSSVILPLPAFYMLKTTGRPDKGIEDTRCLVKKGVYRYVRHPLYASLLFLACGAFLKAPSLISMLLVLAATASLVATSRVEESENLKKFGAEYAEYVKRTKMFVPFLF